MSGRYNGEDFAKDNSPTARKLRGMVRRMAVTLTRKPIWRLLGHEEVDETPDVEQFSGVGFYARPPESGSDPEVITVACGGPRGRVIVASRDEEIRKSIANLEADETAIFTSQAIVLIKADGTVEIRSKNGTALPLPTMADFNALRTYVINQFSTATGHIHATPAGPTTTITTVAAPGTAPTVTPAAAVGTEALKTE